MNIIKPLTYTDPIVGNQLRAYADDRGFAQITLDRGDGHQGMISVRIRDEHLTELIDVLSAARDAGQDGDGR